MTIAPQADRPQAHYPTSRALADAELLKPWLQRQKDAREDRRQYERQWMVNQHFAAGIQHLRWADRDHRVLTVQKDTRGRLLDTVDVLSQYAQTAIGKIASGDLRPEMLCAWEDDRAAEDGNELLNDAVSYAWDEECKLDRRFNAVLRSIVELGTAAVRVRYDRTQGPLRSTSYPHRDGKPLGPGEAVQAMAAYQTGPVPGIEMKPLRDGYICCEKLSAWNLLPPPGIEDPADFPWEIVVRPVALSDLKAMYGAKAADLREDSLDEMGMLAYSNYARPFQRSGDSLTPATVTKLKDHALVYTGYLHPNADFPDGQTVVWAQSTLLETEESLPLTDEPYGPRPGITYFRWTTLEGRFWARAFIEPGIGPQKIRNKRTSQMDEIIDRSMPRTWAEDGTIRKLPRGLPHEVVFVQPGSTIPKTDPGTGPGPWMQQNLEQIDKDIEQALGLKGPSLGNVPTGVSAYSAMALLTENDATKLDPVATDFSLGVADVVRDICETMKQWPQNKRLYIAGPEDTLKVVAWDATRAIPVAFKARPAKGAALPRTQAARVQKVADLANYAATIGIAQQDPDGWMDWYLRSLDAGDPQEFPRKGDGNAQHHKAALENAMIAYGSPAPPVAPYDDAQIHVEEHTDRMLQVSAELALAQQSGDMSQVAALQGQLQQLELHRQLHLAQAQQNAAVNTGQQPPEGLGGVPAQPNGPAPTGGAGGAELPLPQYMNTIQAPRMPYTHGRQL